MRCRLCIGNSEPWLASLMLAPCRLSLAEQRRCLQAHNEKKVTAWVARAAAAAGAAEAVGRAPARAARPEAGSRRRCSWCVGQGFILVRRQQQQQQGQRCRLATLELGIGGGGHAAGGGRRGGAVQPDPGAQF
jgi:hypothetical protein